LFDLVHEVDYLLWYLGMPRGIHGVLLNRGRLGINSWEQAEAVFDYPDGPTVYVGLDYLTRPPIRVFRAFGADGSLEYDFTRRRMTVETPDRAERSVVAGEQSDIYRLQMEDFASVLSGAEPSRLATGEDGTLVLQVCDAWKLSAETGSRVVVH